MTPEQCLAARALLNWSQDELAQVSQVHISTIALFELGKRPPCDGTIDDLRDVLDGAGVERERSGPLNAASARLCKRLAARRRSLVSDSVSRQVGRAGVAAGRAVDGAAVVCDVTLDPRRDCCAVQSNVVDDAEVVVDGRRFDRRRCRAHCRADSADRRRRQGDRLRFVADSRKVRGHRAALHVGQI